VGLDPGTVSLATVPVAAGWLALALVLGRMHEKRAAPAPQPGPGANPNPLLR
jgi:hypothetical protein